MQLVTVVVALSASFDDMGCYVDSALRFLRGGGGDGAGCGVVDVFVCVCAGSDSLQSFSPLDRFRSEAWHARSDSSFVRGCVGAVLDNADLVFRIFFPFWAHSLTYRLQEVANFSDVVFARLDIPRSSLRQVCCDTSSNIWGR